MNTSAELIAIYLDGTDNAAVASAARKLDYQSFLLGQISRQDYDETMSKTDEEIVAERDMYREMDL